jgi:hypothetical protein
MSTPVIHVDVSPPRFDAHYATVTTSWVAEDGRHEHEVGVPSKQALVDTVHAQREQAREHTPTETGYEMAVRLAPGFGEDCTERELRGESTLASYTPGESEFEWATTRPEFETYIQTLRRQPGQQALDLTVSVEGVRKRVFVAARPNGELVATGDTAWLIDLDDTLQTCRLVAALGECRARYTLDTATIVELIGTPLAGCQPFQRRSLMWTSPPSTPAR